MVNNKNVNGLLGYDNSRHKKIKDSLYKSFDESYSPMLSNDEREKMLGEMNDLKASLSGGIENVMAPLSLSDEEREREYRAAARDFLVPEDNELRRRRQWVLSPRTTSELAGSVYDNSVKGIFGEERAAAEADAAEQYRKYATVPGANPFTALGAMHNASDAQKVIGRTMQRAAGNGVDSLTTAYANYARISPADYNKHAVEPRLRDMMMEEYIAEATPKSSAEYIARSAWDNSLTGKMSSLAMQGYSQSGTHDKINRAGLEAYNAGRLENLAAGIGSLLVDAPAFAGLGAGASSAVKFATPKVTKGLSRVLLAKYAPKGMTAAQAEKLVEKAFVSNLSGKIAQSSAAQGLTLGGYDAANSVTEDLLYNDGIDIGKAVDSFAHGAATGALLGVVGTPLKEAARGLTGGRKLAAGAGILSAESGVFTMGTEFEKARAGVEIAPLDILYDFGESAATLAAMRLSHWRPKNSNKKLDVTGRLRRELQFTAPERAEIRNAGLNPTEFIKSIENSLNGEGGNDHVKRAINHYVKLVGDDRLSLATRAKLLYLFEDKIPAASPAAVEYKVNSSANGMSDVTLYDKHGNRIMTSLFSNADDLNDYISRERGTWRRNRIAGLEETLLGKHDSESFYRQMGQISRTTGIGVDKLARMLYKQANNMPLKVDEKIVLDAVNRHTTYGDKNVGIMLHDIRRGVENRFGLPEGALLSAIERGSNDCTTRENRALDQYVDIMQQEVDAIKNGTNEARRRKIQERSARYPYYEEWSNSDIKADEAKAYSNLFAQRSDAPLLESGHIAVPQEWSQPYAWSYLGRKNSVADMERYRRYADKMARRLGFNVNFIHDERELPLTANSGEYNKMLKSQGWVDGSTGEVYVNLPNVSNMVDLERTMLHEVVGHGGLSKLFGEYLYDFYDDVYSKADNELRGRIHAVKRMNKLTSSYDAIEEYLAMIAEKSHPTTGERNLLNRFKGYIGNLLQRNNILTGKNSTVSKADLEALMNRHYAAMLNRTAPDSYRSEVFGAFPSATRGGNYYDAENYYDYLQQKYGGENALRDTPRFLMKDRRERMVNARGDHERRKNRNTYRFIGEKGAYNMSKAGGGDSYDKLALAKEMETLKYGANSIWEKTGWEKGADGEWRFEIPYDKIQVKDGIYQSFSRVNPERARRYKELVSTNIWKLSVDDIKELAALQKESDLYTRNLKLKDVVTDRALFSAYPELKNIPVKYVTDINEKSYYDAKSQTLFIDKQASASPENMRGEIVKSLQQMIQHYEGFSRAISLYKADTENRFAEEYNLAMKEIEAIAQLKKKERNPLLREALVSEFRKKYNTTPDDFHQAYPSLNEYIVGRIYNGKNTLAGNMELNNVLKRSKLTPEIRAAFPGSLTAGFDNENVVPLKSVKELKKHLQGPLDIIYKNLEKMYPDNAFDKNIKGVALGSEQQNPTGSYEGRLYNEWLDRSKKGDPEHVIEENKDVIDEVNKAIEIDKNRDEDVEYYDYDEDPIELGRLDENSVEDEKYWRNYFDSYLNGEVDVNEKVPPQRDVPVAEEDFRIEHPNVRIRQSEIEKVLDEYKDNPDVQAVLHIMGEARSEDGAIDLEKLKQTENLDDVFKRFFDSGFMGRMVEAEHNEMRKHYPLSIFNGRMNAQQYEKKIKELMAENDINPDDLSTQLPGRMERFRKALSDFHARESRRSDMNYDAYTVDADWLGHSYDGKNSAVDEKYWSTLYVPIGEWEKNFETLLLEYEKNKKNNKAWQKLQEILDEDGEVDADKIDDSPEWDIFDEHVENDPFMKRLTEELKKKKK